MEKQPVGEDESEANKMHKSSFLFVRKWYNSLRDIKIYFI